MTLALNFDIENWNFDMILNNGSFDIDIFEMLIFEIGFFFFSTFNTGPLHQQDPQGDLEEFSQSLL